MKKYNKLIVVERLMLWFEQYRTRRAWRKVCSLESRILKMLRFKRWCNDEIKTCKAKIQRVKSNLVDD